MKLFVKLIFEFYEYLCSLLAMNYSSNFFDGNYSEQFEQITISTKLFILRLNCHLNLKFFINLKVSLTSIYYSILMYINNMCIFCYSYSFNVAFI